MSYTDSPLLILCAFLCFNFYWQYIFFIPTLPVKSFKRKVCSSGLKIDKAPLKLSILLTILLSYMYFYFHTSMFRYMSSTKFTTFMLYMYMFLKINCGKSNLRTRSAIFPVVLFLSYLHVFLWLSYLGVPNSRSSRKSLLTVPVPAACNKLFKPLHRTS